MSHASDTVVQPPAGYRRWPEAAGGVSRLWSRTAVFELLPSAYVAAEGEPGAALRPYHGMVTAVRPPDLRGAPRVLPGPPSGVTPTAVTRVTAVALA